MFLRNGSTLKLTSSLNLTKGTVPDLLLLFWLSGGALLFLPFVFASCKHGTPVSAQLVYLKLQTDYHVV